MPIDSEPPDLSAPLSEAVAIDAVGAHAAESAGHGGPVHAHCENCGTALAGPYCHRCGQHDFDYHRSFGHMFLDALENFFHFDAKLFRNIVTLLFQPGRLSAEFNAGHRAAQMPPLRLYIFVSLIFFVLVFAGNKLHAPSSPDEDLTPMVGATVNGRRATTTEALLAASQDLTAGTAAARQAKAPELAAAAARLKAAAAKPAGTREKSAFARWFEEQARRLKDPAEIRELIEKFLHSLPKMMLFCLPFFALYTRFLFRQSGQVYLQHLVIALHFHTFVFLWLMVSDGWVFLAGLPAHGLARAVRGACNLWLFLYPVLMLRRLFANSWKRTIFKTFVLVFLYDVTLGLGFVITALIVFLLL